MDVNNIVLDALNQVVEQIKTNIDSKGKTASGKAKREMEIQQDGNVYRVLVTPYFQTLEEGRSGGKVPYNFKDIIKQWAKDKGLNFSTERELNRFSYLTARKIANFGTEQYRIGKRNDIYTDAINNFTDSLTNKLTELYQININKMI